MLPASVNVVVVHTLSSVPEPVMLPAKVEESAAPVLVGRSTSFVPGSRPGVAGALRASASLRLASVALARVCSLGLGGLLSVLIISISLLITAGCGPPL